MGAPLYVKPKNLRYVDLCIYIDKTFYSPERDDEKCFEYLYILSYMLSSKAKYFNNVDDYDAYSVYLAKSTYQRLCDTTKPPLKSVLNYMKKIMYFRKAAYQRETFSEIIDPVYNKSWNSDLYAEKEMTRLESNNTDLLKMEIESIMSGIPQEIKRSIPKVYESDKILYNDLYKSSLLTLLSQVTLPRERIEYLEDKIDKVTAFNVEGYYNQHLEDSLILWHVPKELESVVKVIINKTRLKIAEDIKEVISDFKMDEKSFNDINKNTIFADVENYDYRD